MAYACKYSNPPNAYLTTTQTSALISRARTNVAPLTHHNNTEAKHEVWQVAQEADRGEPPGVAGPVLALQGAQAARQRHLRRPTLAGRRGRIRRPPRRRDRQVQFFLPRAGGGVHHPAQGAAGEDKEDRGGEGAGAGGRARGGDRRDTEGDRQLPRRDGSAPQLQQHQLHGAGEDPEEVRQAHRRGAAAAGDRERAEAALLHDGAGLQAGEGVRGDDGGRVPGGGGGGPPGGAPGARGAGRRRAEHLPQHGGRAPHHAGGAARELDLRPLLAAAAQPAGLRLAPVVPAAVSDPHPMMHQTSHTISISASHATKHTTLVV